jgi:hypothetical protein
MYPVTYESDYVEQRSRLTTFFRLILAIPWMIVGIFWGIAALVCSVLAWFAIVFTGRYPEGLYNVCAQALRFVTRVNSWMILMTDAWPSFGGGEEPDYPIRLRIAPPLEKYSRAKTFFRFILLIPITIILYLVGLVGQAIGILAWLIIVVTGKEPRGIFDVTRFTQAYQARATAYHFLMTETYPPFSADDESAGSTATSAPVTG